MYYGTLLPQTNEPVEIKKSVLDLLKKINEVDTKASNVNPVLESAVIGGVNINEYFINESDPTGFINNNQMSVFYDPVTRIVYLKGSVKAYWRGQVIPEFVDNWKSPPVPPNTMVPYFLYYDGRETIWSTTPWTFDMMQISYVYFRTDGTFLFATKECHGLMPWTCHEEFHQTTGTYRLSGGLISSIVPASTTPANRRPATSSCIIKDEDLYTTNSAALAGNYTRAWIAGTVITSSWGNDDIVALNGDVPYYNLNTAGVWSQQPMTNNSYMCLWQIALPAATDTDSQRYKFFWLQGQSEGTLASQQALSPSVLELGALLSIAPEFVFITKVIIRYTAANWSVTEFKYLVGTKYQQVSMITP